VNPAAQALTQQQATSPDAAPKTGASKFDQVMANKAATVQSAQQVPAPDAVMQAQQVTKTAASGKLRGMKVDWARAEKGIDPVEAKSESSKALNQVQKFLGEVEKGQSAMDKIIQTSLSAKKMNQQELLGMQAMVYRYSQELELTSKVVEKATGGLKDTLHTQV
jgi:hypothetical protein